MMDIKKQAKLTFKGVDIVGLTCKVENQLDRDNDVNVTIKPSLFLPEDESPFFKIIMDVSLAQPDRFEIGLIGIGNFEFTSDLSSTEKEALINVNAPAIMFPYIRAFIASLTSIMGEQFGGALNIPPQFFQGQIPKFSPPVEE